MSKFNRPPVQVSPAIAGKWGDAALLDEGYVPVPKKLIRFLSAAFDEEAMKPLSAVLAIVDFHRANLHRNPTNDYLAFLAGLPDKDFLDAVGKAMDKGLLEMQPIEGPEDEASYDFSPLVKKVLNLSLNENQKGQQTVETSDGPS